VKEQRNLVDRDRARTDPSLAQGTGGTILSMLLEDLQDTNPRVRALAVKQMADCRDGGVIEHLIELAQDDPSLDVRCTAISALGHFIYAGGISAYDPETDQDAVHQDEGLSQEDLERVYDFLLSVYQDESRSLDERRHAVEAQSFFSNDTIENTILELYARPEKPARLSALIAMGRNGSMRWVNYVRRELYSSDRDIQLEAIHAAGAMSLESLGKDLLRLTYAEDREVLLAALWSLGQTGWDGAFERLDEMTLHSDPQVRELADEAMDEWLFYNGLNSEYDESEDDLLLDG
jgi:HEAT repeat protein